jgi:hypothetical protein
MDSKTILRLVLVVGGTVLIPTSHLRAADPRGLKLPRPMVVEGIYLRAAVYDVEWKLQGTHAAVTFSRKGRAVATVQGELSTFARTVTNDTLYFSKQPDGFFYLNALGFANTNKIIVFPVLRARPNAAADNPAAKALMEDDSPNRTQPVPRVFR